jgi:hypothetical protein
MAPLQVYQRPDYLSVETVENETARRESALEISGSGAEDDWGRRS